MRKRDAQATPRWIHFFSKPCKFSGAHLTAAGWAHLSSLCAIVVDVVIVIVV
ncbi:hypothetical protein K457DRAFT_12628 [Linnemannia elongata AG-77]|uniref:Uncharacterized protein n=1 Tax=Linnemannia elongata AG-77 TaxID=1314771 RepID=A0A197KHK1_9FUNG|nr:hypothetical protein K457DRAFT_12628 [Linnemannia elongata AG-77]